MIGPRDVGEHGVDEGEPGRPPGLDLVDRRPELADPVVVAESVDEGVPVVGHPLGLQVEGHGIVTEVGPRVVDRRQPALEEARQRDVAGDDGQVLVAGRRPRRRGRRTRTPRTDPTDTAR